MPTAGEITYQARLPLPDALERGGVSDLSCPIYDAGALVAPSSGTVSIYDATDTAIVDGDAVVVASSTATYEYTAPATLTLGDGYRVVWTLTISGSVETIRNDAAVVRRRLYCPITDLDLYRIAPALDPSGTDPITRETNFDDYLTEAWTSIQLRLAAQGDRPNLVIAASALREVAIHTALALIWGTMAHRLSPAYAELAREHRDLTEAAWGRVSLHYAPADSATGEGSRRRGRPAVLWLGRG